MIIGALMGSLAAGGGAPSVAWNSINYTTVNEGQTNGVNLDFTNWDGTTVYWYLTNGSSQLSSSQVTSSGMFIPPTANGTYGWTFTFNNDSVTDGNLTYYVRVEDQFGTLLVPQQGPFTCLDTSQTPSGLFSLEPAGWSGGIWPDQGGFSHPATTYSVSNQADAGGSLYFSSGAYASVTSLQNSTFSSLSFSTWIKPSALSGSQVIFGKVFCYLLKINSDGSLTLLAGDGVSGWVLINSTTSAGLITAGQWSHVGVTIGSTSSRIFVNGVKVLETNGCSLGSSDKPLNIGAYTGQTNDTNHGDFFTGYIGVTYMANFAYGEDTFITNFYNDSTGRYGATPIPTSLVFQRVAGSNLKYTGSTTDWAPGNTWTIEWWGKINPANYGPGPVYPVVCQEAANTGIDVFYNNGYVQAFNGAVKFTQPRVVNWHHIAIVKEGSQVKAFVNGRQVSLVENTSSTLSNTTLPLYVGARVDSGGNIYANQVFDGQLTGIRINTTALYSSNFTPVRVPTAPSGTVLLLNSSAPYTDQSTSGHALGINANVIRSIDLPVGPATGGTGTAATLNGFTITPSIAGRVDASTAYVGDVITWTITSNAGWGGYLINWWVDNNTVPASTWAENTNNGSLSLDGNGTGTFTRTVAQNVHAQFRMLIGHDLYQGGSYPMHGYIGV